ncbi:MAG: hypothetical protein JXB39_16460 [Deltaproteobacteria bacterium]|nr:hypothetical protein [Deltaproteobacteria bacterium]
MIAGTLRIWWDAAREAVRTLGRTGWAFVALLVLSALLGGVGAFSGRLGIAGGFLYGMAAALVAGAYLSLLGVGVLHRRKVRLVDVKDAFGQHFWDVISVLFVFWVATLILGLTRSDIVVTVAIFAAWIAFNPAPEVVYQGSSRSLALLVDAGRFVLDNWVEWYLPQVVLGAGLWLLAPHLSLQSHAALFGPFFGFVQAAQALGAAPGFLGGLVEALLLVGGVHVVMVFRGELYRALAHSSRRTRTWRARFRPDGSP